MLHITDRSRFVGHLRILVVDHNAAQRAQLCARFEQASVTADALASIGEFDPYGGDPNSIIVHDDGAAVAEAVAWSMGLASRAPVLAYSLNPQVAQVVQAMKVGASDYLDGPIDDSAIERIIEQALEASAQSTRSAERQFHARWAIDRLTAREKQVLEALSRGLTSQQIAKDLSLSARTVETHRYNLRRKLGSIRTAEALRLVFEHGLGDTNA